MIEGATTGTGTTVGMDSTIGGGCCWGIAPAIVEGIVVAVEVDMFVGWLLLDSCWADVTTGALGERRIVGVWGIVD